MTASRGVALRTVASLLGVRRGSAAVAGPRPRDGHSLARRCLAATLGVALPPAPTPAARTAEAPDPSLLADGLTAPADHDAWPPPPVYVFARGPQVPAVRLRSRQRSAWFWAVVCVMAAAVVVPAVVRPASDRTSPTAPGPLFHLLPPAIQRTGVIRVGTTVDDQKPVVFDGATHGLDPDLLRAMGRELGVRVEFTLVRRETLIQGIQDRSYNVAAAGLIETPDRSSRVDFVGYFTAGSVITVRTGNPDEIRSLADLCGKHVAVVHNSIEQGLTSTQKCGTGTISPVSVASPADALVKVREEVVDAGLTDFPSAAYASTPGSGLQVVPRQIGSVPYGFAVAKRDPALRRALTAALDTIIDDGTYQRILANYLLTAGAVTAARVNGGG